MNRIAGASLSLACLAAAALASGCGAGGGTYRYDTPDLALDHDGDGGDPGTPDLAPDPLADLSGPTPDLAGSPAIDLASPPPPDLIAPADLTPASNDRWAALDNLRDAQLVQALRGRIGNHKSLGYNGARDVLFAVTGGVPIELQGGLIECAYTGRTTRPDGSNTPGNMNTEHTWPQSLGADKEPAKSDLHHLFPTDATANSYRSSYPFGDTDCNDGGKAACAWQGGGSALGTRSGGTEKVFEVRPVRRGDLARAIFYFSVRYALPIANVEEATLRAWHRADPPDPRERTRNDAVESYQRNRNPFIDRPDFVDAITDF